MDVQQKVEFLTSELQGAQDRFRSHRSRDKRKALALQVAVVAFSASITVMLGIRANPALKDVLSNIALVLSATITVVAAIDAFFDHRGLWINRSNAINRLENLDRRTRFYLAGCSIEEIDPAELERYLSELNTILGEAHRDWLRLRSSATSRPGNSFSLSPSTSPDGGSPAPEPR